MGILGALHVRSPALSQQHSVSRDGGPRSWGRCEEEKRADIKKMEEGSRIAAEDVAPELVFSEATKVALHGDVGIGESCHSGAW